MIVAAASQLSWYLTRGAGFLALIALTGSVLLGILSAQRWSPNRDAKVRYAALHQTVALLGLAGLSVHIATAVADPFTHLGIATVVDPLHRSYRPLWLGIGVLASDIFIAVIITSLLRHRLGFRSWKYVHLSSYLIWAMAMVHGLGTGSDTRFLGFDLVYILSLASVIVALWSRVLTKLSGPKLARYGVYGATALFPAILISWALQGPLKPTWASSFTSAKVIPKSINATPTAFEMVNVSIAGSIFGVTQKIPSGGFVIAGGFSSQPAAEFQVDYLGTVKAGIVSATQVLVYVGTSADPRMYSGSASYYTPNFVSAQVANAKGQKLYLQLDLGMANAHKLYGAGLLTSSPQQLPVLPAALPQKVVTIVEKVPVVQQVPVYVSASSGSSGGDN